MAYEENKKLIYILYILNPTFVVDMDITFAALPLISFLVRSSFFFFPKKEKKIMLLLNSELSLKLKE